MGSFEKDVTAQLRRSSHGARQEVPDLLPSSSGGAGGEDSLRFPAVGEVFDDCLLLAELGRGAEGRVYLATQTALADRPVVLKVTPLRGGEHLSMARLVHTHIAPLLFVRDFPGAGLRLLAMPYVGGTSLSRVLTAFCAKPPPRTGGDVLAEVDRIGAGLPPAVGVSAPLRQRLAGLSYPAFVAWVGASLADGLAHAHERGLLHLDVKPGNVLLAADGHPLLLDFHLARPALAAGSLPPDLFGGSRGYMPPEQGKAGDAFRNGQPTSVGVDERADVYALGVVLFEMLTDELPENFPPAVLAVRLRRLHGNVSTGLTDILLRCLAPDPARRYQRAADLADDLRRHLTNQPLRGVSNRDVGERWRKWRRRHPGAVGRLALAALVFVAFTVGLVMAGRSMLDTRQAVALAIDESRQLAENGDLAQAVHLLDRTPLPAGWPGASSWAADLTAQRKSLQGRLAAQRARLRREQAASDLARLANDLRLGWDVDRLRLPRVRQLDRQCTQLWARREHLQEPPPTAEERDDLLELVLMRIRLRQRLGGSPEATRPECLALLDEAEETVGANPTLAVERQWLASGALPAGPAGGKVAASENYWAGRLLLRAGKIEKALERFGAAGEQRPDAFWPCFYRGVCAHRLGWFEEAERAFRICLALMPRSAAVYVNRATALAALGRNDPARANLDRALLLDPRLAQAWFQRGLLNAKEKRFPAAIADLERGLESGSDGATGHFNLAVIYREMGDDRRARLHVEQALADSPDDGEALRLQKELGGGTGTSPRR